MSTYVDVTLIIPTYNRLVTLSETLSTLFSGDTLPNEVIIIDQSEDYLTNKTVITKMFNGYRINLIYFYQKKLSLTKARNTAISKATNNILIFSDDDICFKCHTIKNIFNYMRNEKYTLVAGLDELAPKNKSLLAFVFGNRSYKKRNCGHISYGIYGRYPNITDVKKETLTEWAMGYLFAVKKEYLISWDIRFDEKLASYAYGEDLEFSGLYCRKSQELGKKCILSPKVIVEHRCSREWRISNDIQNLQLIVNRYYIKNVLFPGRAIYSLVFWWSNIGVLIKKIIINDNAKAFFKAIVFCHRYRKDIKIGNFHSEEFTV